MNVLTIRFAPKIDLPLRYFSFGLLCLGGFGILLPLYSDQVLAQYHYTHESIALTHLLVLGWITSVIMGALTQLAPMALGVPLYSEKLARWTFWFFAVGILGMVGSFWIWNFRILLWFGTSLAIAMALFLYNMGKTLRRIPQRDIVFFHVATSLFYLAITFLAGQFLIHDKVMNFSPFSLMSAIHAHAHLAVAGWFMMMIMGISYRLIPMFLMTEIQSLKRCWVSFGLMQLALPILFAGILLQKAWTPMAALGLCFGVGIWFWEMMAIFMARKRPVLDPTFQTLMIALLHIPVLMILGVWLSFPDGEMAGFKAQLQTGYALLAILGFVSLFTLGMLHKVIPFLVWYHIYPPLVGSQAVPDLKDLYSERWQKRALKLLVAGIWITSWTATLAGQVPPLLIQGGALLMSLGLIANIINLFLPIAHWAKQVQRGTRTASTPSHHKISVH